MDWIQQNRTGIAAALAAASLFGLSVPLAKVLVRNLNPWLLAGLLYLGAGLGLAGVRWFRLGHPDFHQPASLLRPQDWFWLLAATGAGGLVAPVLLMFGLTDTPAAVVSLLLNLEGVFTALLAWVFFQEQYDRRLVLGLAAISVGAVLLAGTGTWAWSGFWGPLAVTGACLAWGLDNNLSRKVALGDPVWIAMVKGLAAGSTNLVLAFWQDGIMPDMAIAFFAGLLGFLSYGASLVLFLLALRHLGAARTGAYFSVAPFVGVLVSIMLFREEISAQFLAAAGFMAWGIWLHFTEHHEHGHIHEPGHHEHVHRHGPHHQHPHAEADSDPDCEPHCHWHVHFPVSHRHEHFPDTNHRHRH